jgi:hypothetical protein
MLMPYLGLAGDIWCVFGSVIKIDRVINLTFCSCTCIAPLLFCSHTLTPLALHVFYVFVHTCTPPHPPCKVLSFAAFFNRGLKNDKHRSCRRYWCLFARAFSEFKKCTELEPNPPRPDPTHPPTHPYGTSEGNNL